MKNEIEKKSTLRPKFLNFKCDSDVINKKNVEKIKPQFSEKLASQLKITLIEGRIFPGMESTNYIRDYIR